jgi:hypothetical protein
MMENIFEEIKAERRRQDEKWGEQNHPMLPELFSLDGCRRSMEVLKRENELASKRGKNCWYHILAEEALEVFAETEPEKQRAEMIQVAAVAVAIIECLDRKLADEAQERK